jgi:hypothetical protein
MSHGDHVAMQKIAGDDPGRNASDSLGDIPGSTGGS